MYGWENEAAFNPAAIFLGGRVHLMYRALGSDGKSVFGYASSSDGIHFDERLPFPIFTAKHMRQHRGSYPPVNLRKYGPEIYASGGGWYGCEDPRLVVIDERVYLIYLAFAGWDSMRMAVTSLSTKQFLAQEWQWRRPRYLSPGNQRHKNWVLFPEKINGLFVILHNLHTEDMNKVRIEYIDNLDTFDAESARFHSPDPRAVQPRHCAWHTRARSAGPPPIKTDKGWLVLYHATDEAQSNRFKLGAMLLDLNDPQKVVARSQQPILEPDEWYENDWKPGIVYSCGAVVMDNTLLVYYGGGDKHVAVATIPLNTLLESMEHSEPISFSPHTISHS